VRSYEAKAKFFDRYAEQWEEEGFSDEQMAKIKAVLERLDIQPGMAILEPGCGPGRLTKILVELVGPSGRIIAVDISPKMIEVCRRVAGNQNVRAILGEIETIDLEENSVDLILCFAAFPHFNDKPAALKVFASCLKPDGRLAIVHLIGSAQINDLHRKAGTAVEDDVLPSAQDMERMLGEAGFRVDELRDSDSGYFLSASHT